MSRAADPDTYRNHASDHGIRQAHWRRVLAGRADDRDICRKCRRPRHLSEVLATAMPNWGGGCSCSNRRAK